MSNIPSEIRTYLNQRGITDEIILSHNLGWTGSKISIPVYDKEGKFLFNKYRRSPFVKDGPKYTYDSGANGSLYNIQALDKDSVIINEGELDTLLLVSYGFSALSSTSGASTFKPEWVPLFENKEVFICYDNDKAGIKGAMKVQGLLPHAKIIGIPTNFGIKDVTDFFICTPDPFNEFCKLKSEAMTYEFPIEPKGFDSKDIVRQYINDMKMFLERYTTVKRDILNKEKSDVYVQNAIDYCINKINEYSRTIKPSRNLSDDKLQRAKSYPIPNLIKFNSCGFAKCLWHNDHTPSLHYYKKENRVYCFSCGEHHDSIDVYQKINNCSLSEAIKKLNELLT